MAQAGERRIVLVGAGHAHVEVLRRFGKRKLPGWRVLLVSPDEFATYSGMVPGVVAGLYDAPEARIGLVGLVERCGAIFIQGRVCGLDPAARRLMLVDGTSLTYDLVSLDVGITPDLSGIGGAGEFGWPVKPIADFLARFEELAEHISSRPGSLRVVTIGGGTGGVELTLALEARLRRLGAGVVDCSFALVSAGALLDGQGAGLAARLRALMKRRGIEVREHDPVIGITANEVETASGRRLPCDLALITTGAAAPVWLASAGLALDERGFLLTDGMLQCLGRPDIFAAGDCAGIVGASRPKAGVFAVRAGPVLADNLRARALSRTLVEWSPQKRHLALISLGDRRAVAAWNGLVAEGRWAWWLKDWIDRRWMARYRSRG
jgi:pyridine nucleotide-disulfide oxidoreductase family protein